MEVVSNAQGSKGFGFLTFLRRRDGERAMQVKNGTIADGRKITVCSLRAHRFPMEQIGLFGCREESFDSFTIIDTTINTCSNSFWM